jgi:hypothetical protein
MEMQNTYAEVLYDFFRDRISAAQTKATLASRVELLLGSDRTAVEQFYRRSLGLPPRQLYDNYEYPSYLFPLTVSLSSVIAVFCLLLTGYLVAHRNNPIFKAASVSFLIVISLSAIPLVLSSILFVTTPTSDSICSARAWLLSLSFVAFFSPLLAKTYRVVRIFSSKRLHSLKLANRTLFSAIGLSMIGTLLLLMIFELLPNSNSSTIELYNFANGSKLVFGCNTSSTFLSLIFVYMVCILFVAVSLFRSHLPHFLCRFLC